MITGEEAKLIFKFVFSTCRYPEKDVRTTFHHRESVSVRRNEALVMSSSIGGEKQILVKTGVPG